MSGVDEKKMALNVELRSSESSKDAPLLGQKSPGVDRMEAIAAHITFWDRVAIFFGVFLIAYAYGLDGTLRYSYQVCSFAIGCGQLANKTAHRHVELQNAFDIGHAEHHSGCCRCRRSGMFEENSLARQSDIRAAYCRQNCRCVWQS